MLAKHWTPGLVKTRLAQTVGAQQAAALHHVFVSHLLEELRGVADDSFLVGWPPEQLPAFTELTTPFGWQAAPQSPGDLGARLAHCFAAAFSAGCEQVVVIGADSPTLPRAYVMKAFALLAEVPIVLGPATDGGYYLVGACGSVPPIFADIPWSTPEVWQATTARLSEAGIPLGTLDTWYDVDDATDLDRLCAELARSEDDKHRKLLGEIERVLSRS